jgi:hypothetical protein
MCGFDTELITVHWELQHLIRARTAFNDKQLDDRLKLIAAEYQELLENICDNFRESSSNYLNGTSGSTLHCTNPLYQRVFKENNTEACKKTIAFLKETFRKKGKNGIKALGYQEVRGPHSGPYLPDLYMLNAEPLRNEYSPSSPEEAKTIVLREIRAGDIGILKHDLFLLLSRETEDWVKLNDD